MQPPYLETMYPPSVSQSSSQTITSRILVFWSFLCPLLAVIRYSLSVIRVQYFLLLLRLLRFLGFQRFERFQPSFAVSPCHPLATSSCCRLSSVLCRLSAPLHLLGRLSHFSRFSSLWPPAQKEFHIPHSDFSV